MKPMEMLNQIKSVLGVELSTEEIAKPIKHNPESKGEMEMNLYAQNKPMSTQDRVFAKLFKN